VSATAHDAARWFSEHFDQAADQVLAFLGDDGISLEGRRVADVGCGDGIIDLGLALKGKPAELVGFDLMDVDTEGLLRSAATAGVAESLPESLHFERSQPVFLPAPDDHFDIVVSWSVFEHVDDPVGLLREVRRVLSSDGVLFVQLWPFYASEHGGHLWPHYGGGYPHELRRDEQILGEIEGERATDPRRSAEDEFRSLNRITLDDLHRALLVNHFAVAKLELLTHAVHIPRELAHRPLADLGVSGIKLLANPV
jgi:SAM-dependent methyltransferase